MTDTAATETRARSTLGVGIRTVVSRMPATIVFVLALLAVGVIWQGLWRSFKHNPLFAEVAYGLPAFLEGRWWTPVTGTFFVVHPWVYLITIASFVGMGYLEWRRGTRVALAYYTVGQLFAIFASALALWLLAFTSLAYYGIEQPARRCLQRCLQRRLRQAGQQRGGARQCHRQGRGVRRGPRPR